MSKRIAWDIVYKDFKSIYPNLRKRVTYWCPHDYLTITLYFDDGRKGLYNFLEHRLKFV